MSKKIIALLALVLFCSHDMYLKMDTYFLESNTKATIQLFNGTFEKSENVITRDRMLDVSLVGNGQRQQVPNSQWSEANNKTILNFTTGNAGTWVAGVSTAARNIEMDAEAFNGYLKHDGVLDMLAWRKENNALDSAAVEKYSKHVKTIFQVGNVVTQDWSTVLGHPIEFVPLQNPYTLHTGDSLQVKLLFKGAPLQNQLVYVDYKPTANGHSHDSSHTHSEGGQHHTHAKDMTGGVPHEHGPNGHTHTPKKEAKNHPKGEPGHTHPHKKEAHKHEHNKDTHTHQDAHHHNKDNATPPPPPVEDHQHTSGLQLRTNQEGIVNFKLNADGIWYLRTIHLVNSQEAGLTHESNWATLTFEVTHGHDPAKGEHTHEEESGLPMYWFVLASIVVVGALFFWFNKKSN